MEMGISGLDPNSDTDVSKLPGAKTVVETSLQVKWEEVGFRVHAGRSEAYIGLLMGA